MALAAAALSARIDACGAMACRLPPSNDDGDIDTYIALFVRLRRACPAFQAFDDDELLRHAVAYIEAREGDLAVRRQDCDLDDSSGCYAELSQAFSDIVGGIAAMGEAREESRSGQAWMCSQVQVHALDAWYRAYCPTTSCSCPN